MLLGRWWQSLLHTKAKHSQVLHVAATSSSLLPSWASPPTPRGFTWIFFFVLLCTHLGAKDIFDRAKQGGASSFAYDRLIDISKTEKQKRSDWYGRKQVTLKIKTIQASLPSSWEVPGRLAPSLAVPWSSTRMQAGCFGTQRKQAKHFL